MNLDLTTDELASTIEALHDTLLRRIAWCVHLDMTSFRTNLEFELAQEVVDRMAQAYTKATMRLKDIDDGTNVSPAFWTTFGLSEDTWDTLGKITAASSWDDIPFHPQTCRCEPCSMLGSRR